MKKHFAKFFALLAVAAILILGILAGKYLESRKYGKENLTSSAVTAQISQLSELSTAELEYRGLVRYSEGEIAFLTKKEFTMIYNAHVKAGVDLSQVSAKVDDDRITVTLPKAQIQEVVIDPNSLEFYDEKAALFNFQNREDTVKALQYAEKDVNSQALETELLPTADQKAQALITSFIQTLWQGREHSPEIQFQTAVEGKS